MDNLYNDELSPLLRDLKQRGDGLQVPEGYFDQLDDAVFARLDASGERLPAADRAPRGWKVWVNVRTVTAAAATLALLLTAGWWLWQPTPTNSLATNSPEDEALELAAAEAYLNEHLMEFDAELLAQNLPGEEEHDAAEQPATTPTAPKTAPHKKTPEDELDEIIDQLSDEELEDLL
jgi:hypothetical protein